MMREADLPDGWLDEEMDLLMQQSAAIKRLKDSLYAHHHYGMSLGPIEVDPHDLQHVLNLIALLDFDEND